MSVPRPVRLTPEQKLSAARKVAADLHRDCHSFRDTPVEELAQQIADHARDHMDGYELAKEMDRSFYWDCDLDVASALDCWNSYSGQELEAAEMAWAAAENPQPPFPIGARVGFKRWTDRGVITGIYEHGAAKYLVKIDGDMLSEPPHESRRIVSFEDVVALPDEPEAAAGQAAPAATAVRS